MPEVTIVVACRRRAGVAARPPFSMMRPSPTPSDGASPALGTSHAVFLRAAGSASIRPERHIGSGSSPARRIARLGHGTVAALAVLAEREAATRLPGRTAYATSRAFDGGRAENSYDLTATFDPGPMSLRAPGNRTPGIADRLGLTRKPFPTTPAWPQRAARLLLPVGSRAALAELRPDFPVTRHACDRYGLLGCYAYSTPDRTGRRRPGCSPRRSGSPRMSPTPTAPPVWPRISPSSGASPTSLSTWVHLGIPSTITANAQRGRPAPGSAWAARPRSCAPSAMRPARSRRGCRCAAGPTAPVRARPVLAASVAGAPG